MNKKYEFFKQECGNNGLFSIIVLKARADLLKISCS